MKRPRLSSLALAAFIVAALVGGVQPITHADTGDAPMQPQMTLYGNWNFVRDLAFAPDAIWGATGLGLVRWDREGAYETQTPAVKAPDGEIALTPWQVRADGEFVSTTRVERLIVDGEGRLWSVGDQLRLLDDQGQVVETYRADDPAALSQYYETLVNCVYTNPNALAVDPTTGWVWIIVPSRGLVAFDGQALHDWRDQAVVPNARTLYISPEGEVWATAASDYVFRYLKAEDAWQQFHYGTDIGLPTWPWPRLMFRLGSDLEGRIWLTTAAGIARFDPATETWEAYFDGARQVYGDQNTLITVDADGAVWTLTGWRTDLYISKQDEATGDFVQVAPLPQYFIDPDPVQNAPQTKQVSEVSEWRQDPEGGAWILTEIGPIRWNGESWQTLRVGGKQLPGSGGNNLVVNAPQLADDPLLFAGGSTKVRLADRAETWPVFSDNPFAVRNLPNLSYGTLGADGKVYALRDRAHLWTFADGQWSEIGQAQDSSNWENPLNNTAMTDLAVDAEGTAWMTSHHGLWRWSNGEWRLYGINEGIPVRQQVRNANAATEQVELDGEGNLWFTTTPYMLPFDNYGGFLVKFDGDAFEVVSELPIHYLGNTGETLRYDAATGLLWLRDLRDLRAFDPATRAWTVVDLSLLGQGVELRDMAPSGDGGVWIITGDGALYRYQDGAFEPLPLPPENPVAGRVGVDPAGNLWVTGLNGAASIWDGDAWRTETADDGLAGGVYRDLIFRGDEVWLLGRYNVDYRQGEGEWTPLFTVERAPRGLDPVTAAIDADGVLWYADGSGVARYVGGAWEVIPIDVRLVHFFDFVKLPEGPLWITARSGLGVFDGIDWTFIGYGPAAPVIGYSFPEWVTDVALGGMDNRLFFGSSSFSLNLRMYSPDVTYWVTFPSSVELKHPVTDMDLGPDGRLWFASGRVAYLDERNKMWAPPSTTTVYSDLGITQISHGSADIFWVYGTNTLFDETRNVLSRCNWFNCDWVFLDPALEVQNLEAISPDEVWVSGPGWLLHVQLGTPDQEPVGGYLRQEAQPTPVTPGVGGAITYNGAAGSGLTAADPIDQWTFNANAGDVVSIIADGVPADATVSLNLFDPDNKLIAFTSGNGRVELLNRELPFGPYTIVVKLEAGTQAGYVLYLYGP